MQQRLSTLLAVNFTLAALMMARGKDVPRPPIVGVAHIALATNDMAAEEAFYVKGLGFAQLSTGRFKVNDHQYIDITPNLQSDTQDRLNNIAFETTNVRQLRDYLAAKGVTVPAKVVKDADGNLTLDITDPERHKVQFVQYMKGSVQGKQFGKLMPETRVSERIIHVGLTVADRAAADRFYKGILGFTQGWQGGPTDDTVRWVVMRVPDGNDWLEYMITPDPNITPKQRGVLHHMALGVPDIQAGFKTVTSRGINPPQPPKIGRDGKWQLNLYDVNFTRSELMEPKPVQEPCCSPYLLPR